VLAALVLPVAIPVFHPGLSGALVALVAALALLVVWMHRANIRRLVAGTEHRFGQRGNPINGEAGS
jgi:glycerol-3-phosphate acyltransferase PlsY